MTNLTAIFGSTLGTSAESEKLLELYWDRAELKKEFANLRNQTIRLGEKIKESKGETARLQQQLDNLENLLLDPDWSFSVLVHFQLRSLDRRCAGLLARFAEQLKQQREKKVRGEKLRNWERKRSREKSSCMEARDDLRLDIQRLEDRLQAERHRYSMLGGVTRFLRRRSTTRTLDEIATEIGAARHREGSLSAEIEAIEAQAGPEVEGLDVATKRLVNYMILSYAQQMYLYFSEDQLAALGKEAAEKGVGAINYGSRADCELLMERLARRLDSVPLPGDCPDILQARARLLANTARFETGDDAVPHAESIPFVYDVDASGAVEKREVNLLAEDYWSLMMVMSR